jgi:hypothetical protein
MSEAIRSLIPKLPVSPQVEQVEEFEQVEELNQPPDDRVPMGLALIKNDRLFDELLKLSRYETCLQNALTKMMQMLFLLQAAKVSEKAMD